MMFWALESVPEEMWSRGVVCPAERALMLGATSRRVRALLAGMQRRVPAAVCVLGRASMDAVVGGLGRLQGWCQVVRLDLKRGHWVRIQPHSSNDSGFMRVYAPIGAAGAGRLARVLGQCSSLTVLNLGGKSMGAERGFNLKGIQSHWR